MESVSRLSSLLETARDLTLEAARDAGPRKPLRPLPAAQIKKLLDSRTEREVLDGLRRVIATLSNPYVSTRPLVYNYLLHHAESDPDTALLSINTIQKSLSDSNPRIRAMALKTMSGIRVPVISQIVSLAIKKGMSDLSPLVRKVAALACVKCIRLDASTRPQVEEYLATLLADKQYYVVGAAMQAFAEVCPDRLDMIHPVFRSLCKMVVDMDEWGQLALLRSFTVYARKAFPQRTKLTTTNFVQEGKGQDFYDNLETPTEGLAAGSSQLLIMDSDLELFLISIQPLLASRNSAVVVSVSRAYLYLSPNEYLHLAVGPLVALLRSPGAIQQVVFANIVQICLTNPTYMAPYYRHFFIRSSESPQIWRLKLEALTLIFSSCNASVQGLILADLEHFSKSHDSQLVRESVRAIGRCAQASDAATLRRCMTLLLKQIHSADAMLVGEAIEVIRHIIQKSPDEHRKTVIRLAKNLDTLTSETARASIVWLVGEFAGFDPENNVAADLLRILIKGYAQEGDDVKAQIVLLAAKVYLHHLNALGSKHTAEDTESSATAAPEPQKDEGFAQPAKGLQNQSTHVVELLFQQTMLLARYTPSYDLRDRARLLRGLLAVKDSTELASLLLLAPKPVPQAPSPSESRKAYTFGSASLVIGADSGINGVEGHTAIPDWVTAGNEPDADLRNSHGPLSEISSLGAVPAGQRLDNALQADPGFKSATGPVKGKSLDDWLDEEEDDEDEDEDDDEDEESDDEDDEDDEESSEYESETESEAGDTEEESGSESEGDERTGLVG